MSNFIDLIEEAESSMGKFSASEKAFATMIIERLTLKIGSDLLRFILDKTPKSQMHASAIRYEDEQNPFIKFRNEIKKWAEDKGFKAPEKVQVGEQQIVNAILGIPQKEP